MKETAYISSCSLSNVVQSNHTVFGHKCICHLVEIVQLDRFSLVL